MMRMMSQFVHPSLQKFPVIYDEVDEAKGKRYAVIVDKAHQINLNPKHDELITTQI